MSEKRRILLVATGGTIASQASEHGLRPGLGAEQMLAYIPELREEYELDAIQVCNIDSTNMTPAVWDEIVAAVECKYLYYDGFVICHGTDTMAYTSAALSYMIQNSNKPIVVTGSQKPISEESTDARQNLIDSIRYAGDPASRGVTLVFNGNVIAGTRAKKTYARSYNAFSSVNFPVLAVSWWNTCFRTMTAWSSRASASEGSRSRCWTPFISRWRSGSQRASSLSWRRRLPTKAATWRSMR